MVESMCVTDWAELSLPAGKALLSTVRSCTVSHCKVPETCRGWVRGSEPWQHHCLAGENLTYHSWCAWAMDSVPHPAWRPSDRHRMNMKVPFSGCSLLFVHGSPSPAHSPLSALSSIPSVSAAVAPVPRSLPLPFISPSQAPCLHHNPWAHPDLSPSALWVCRTKAITRSPFFPKHSCIPVPDIHFTINQALLETITLWILQRFISCSPKDTLYRKYSNTNLF